MQRFTELKVWQEAHALVLEVYTLTGTGFPTDERFGVMGQIRRAVVSVASNIAEGSKRRTGRDFAHFINMAEASLAEVEYLLMLSRDLSFLSEEKTSPILGEIDVLSRRLHALRVKVEQSRK